MSKFLWAWADAVHWQVAATRDIASALEAVEWFLRREASRALPSPVHGDLDWEPGGQVSREQLLDA